MYQGATAGGRRRAPCVLLGWNWLLTGPIAGSGGDQHSVGQSAGWWLARICTVSGCLGGQWQESCLETAARALREAEVDLIVLQELNPAAHAQQWLDSR